MKKLLILLTGFILAAMPGAAQAGNGAFGTAGAAIADTVTVAAPPPVSNTAAPITAVTLVIILAGIYILRRGIQRKIRTLRRTLADSPVSVSPVVILEIIQSLLGIIFPAVTAVLLALHLSGVIPYISTAEEIAGILLSTGIAICEILDWFLGEKKSGTPA
jgi:hypothetical protein